MTCFYKIDKFTRVISLILTENLCEEFFSILKNLPAPSGIGLSWLYHVRVVFGLESFAVQASCSNSPARTGSGFPKVTLMGGTVKIKF